MALPNAIEQLVNRFRRHYGFEKTDPNEAEVRASYITPLFAALGWDFHPTADCAPRFRDVVLEASIEQTGQAADYCFRIGETRILFVEAKSLSVKVKNDRDSSLQLRGYGWTTNLPICILTNFREFAVYDCRIRPKKTDLPSVARIRCFTFEEFAEQWEYIEGTFSKAAVLRGDFDNYVGSALAKEGTAAFDDIFLKEIESWRLHLASEINSSNPDLSVRELNFAVQRLIDRLLFLRISEGRGLEPRGALRSLLDGRNIYPRLLDVLKRADEKYDSELFCFGTGKEDPDSVSATLQVRDKPMRKVIAGMYYPESMYAFHALPSDTLGQVYERFLGKAIVRKGRGIAVDKKPELRKAGGVYYTPSFVVDYIVRNTAGAWLVGKSPTEAKRLTILDPACGSGSFLVAAYQYLLDWFLQQYVQEGVEKHRRRIYQSRNGDWRLTTAERQGILRNSIFGVDLDEQAVEVTKLSLLLKVVEGESDLSYQGQLELFPNLRALPNLSANIRWGNSLIGSDFYDTPNAKRLEDEDRDRICPFEWKSNFKTIFRGSNPGFQLVIGNPPYRRELDYKELLDEIAVGAFGRTYHAPRMDLWYYFVHRSLDLLLKKGGVLSFITNAYWVAGTGAGKLIDHIRQEAHLDEVFCLGKLRVFRRVSGQHLIFRITKRRSSQPTLVKVVPPTNEKESEPFVIGRLRVLSFKKQSRQLYRHGKVDLEVPADKLLGKIERHPRLSTIALVRQGIAENPPQINAKTNKRYGNRWKTGEGVFALQADELAALRLPEQDRELLRPYHDLCDLGRYSIASQPSLTLIYSTKATCPDINHYSRIRDHLRRFKPILDARRETRNGGNAWWHLHWPRDEWLWMSAKIISIQMAGRPSFTASAKPVYVPFSANVLVPFAQTSEDLYYLLAILNSRLLWKWYQHNAKSRGVALEINGNVLKRTPIRRIDLSSHSDRELHQKLSEYAKQMISLSGRLNATRAEHSRITLQRQLDAIDRNIDDLVYSAYKLSAEDIELVEAMTSVDVV